MKVDSCLAYSSPDRTRALLEVHYMNECIYTNNKFFGTGTDKVPVAMFDSCSQQTLIGNSFAFTSAYAPLSFSANKGNRISGNHITHNLFEECRGAYSCQMIGYSGNEGDSNSFTNNRYLEAPKSIYLDHVVGTQIIDYLHNVQYGEGARRNFFITPYATVSEFSVKNPNGNSTIAFDGRDMTMPIRGSGIVLVSPNGQKAVRISAGDNGEIVHYTLG